MSLRHSMDIVVYGIYELMIPESKEIFAYTRTLDGEKLLVVCNFTKEIQIFINEEDFENEQEVLISNYSDCMMKNRQLILRPYETKVIYWK